MSSINKQLFKSLKELRLETDALVSGDKDGIAKIGARIEHLLTENQNELSAVENLLMLSLTALQKIYEDENADFLTIISAISAALVVTEQSVASPGNTVCEEMRFQAGESLQMALESVSSDSADSAEAVFETSAGEIDAPPSLLENLDAVNALLIQIGADDKEDIVRISESLKTLTALTENVEHRKLMVKAGRNLNKIIAGKAANADQTLDEVGEMLAQIGSGDNQTKASQKSAAEVSSNRAAGGSTLTLLPPVEETVDDIFLDTAEQALDLQEDLGLLNEFIIESRELIEAAEGSLLTLENEPENIESINTVFRAFHSVKGAAAFLNLTDMTAFAHLAESLLSRMRDREIRCTGGYANLALRSVDLIKEMLEAIEAALPGKVVSLPNDYANLIELLKNPEAHGISAEARNQSKPTGVKSSENAESDAGAKEKKNASSDSSVRVRTERLDSLIDMVGELVIAQSMLAQDTTVAQGLHPELSRKISHAGKIVRELQDLTMAMRMIPLKNTFQKMARIVRDVAQKCGKQIDFVTVGEDTEIDRNMVDFIADPLVHMVRNAADHGIEKPEIRSVSDKPLTGKIKLAAYHAGGDVVVELTDDGAGLDREKLIHKAISQNLIESEKGMSDNQIYNLIFAPGFSTAETITDVSGRGVGMDVVRRNIEAMRGRIEIDSEKGQGSKFTIRLPLTLAITDGMLIRVGTERFIVPTINIHLSFRPSTKMLASVAGRGELVSLRGELMPIFRLHKLFEVENANEDPTQALLMIVADGSRRCALMVDELLGQQQVVAKTLGQGIGKIQGVSGGAILGDGCVGLILDLAEIVALARQSSTPADRREAQYQKIAV